MKNRVFKLAGGLALAGVLFVSNFSTATANTDEAPPKYDLLIEDSISIDPGKLGWWVLGPNWFVTGKDAIKNANEIRTLAKF